jgi:hypothetical protein
MDGLSLIINLTTEILLFGSLKLAPNQNVELFLAVKQFVFVVSDSLLKVFFVFLFSLSLFLFFSLVHFTVK